MPGFDLPRVEEKIDNIVLPPILKTIRPKTFGIEARALFMLDDEYTNLNHGSFGSVPKAVHEASELLSRYIESNPDRFIRLEHSALIDAARAVVAEHIGVDRDTCVFVSSVSAGIATALRSFPWSSQDFIVCSDVIYDTISSSVKEICRGEHRPQRSVFEIKLPLSHASILELFRRHLRSLRAQIQAASTDIDSTPGKIVVIIESITSSPGILMPWQEMVRICRSEYALSVVDAAHSFGQEVSLDLKAVDPDFWVSNGAKWCYAKRGCAVLYVPFRNQDMVASGVLPGLIYGSPSGISPTRFVWQFYFEVGSGLMDPVPPISIIYAIKFRQQIGGEISIQKYCHELAVRGGRRMAEIVSTTVLDSPANNAEVIANMVNVELPLSASTKPSAEIQFLFSQELFETHKLFATCFVWQEKWWSRVSAQIYNEIGDFERLAKALIDVCGKITAARGTGVDGT